MVVRKEHLTVESRGAPRGALPPAGAAGLNKILSIKAVMNGNGLSEKLNKEFPKLIPIARPLRKENKHLIQLGETYYKGFNLVNQEIYDPSWLVGFIDGEACFFC